MSQSEHLTTELETLLAACPRTVPTRTILPLTHGRGFNLLTDPSLNRLTKPVMLTLVKPPTAIFDIDGVLSESWNRRSFIRGPKPDWPGFFDACEGDTPLPLCQLALHLEDVGWEILFVTSRPEGNREKTQAWLKQYAVCHTPALYMRPEDHDIDHRSVTWKVGVVRDLCDRYSVKLIFEDDPSIIRALRALALPVVPILSGYYQWLVPE
jgi:hypothetical protein